MANFAIVGVAGYIAPRHLAAISATGHSLIAAYDPFDSVGRLDSFSPRCQFFTGQSDFEAYVEEVRGTERQIEWLSVCTPNHTHAQYIRYGLTHGMNVICEKPAVLLSEEIDDIMELEKATGHQVYVILQLRLHDRIAALKRKVETGPSGTFHNVDLTYITSRGNWYYSSWKGDIRKSGGVATNIGVHLFDMVRWLFGNVMENKVDILEKDRVSGCLELERAHVRYFLSINEDDLPENAIRGEKRTYRILNIDGEEFEFSNGFTELHTKSYEEIFAGRGFRISETADSIRIVEKLRPVEEIALQMVDLEGQYQKIEAEVNSGIRKVLGSATFIGGPMVNSFSENLSRYMGGCCVVTCGNGTDALQIALMALELPPGSEVIVPAFTYVAAAEAVALLGLVPVPADVDCRTFNISAAAVRRVISSRTKAIIPVHLFGQSCEMEAILQVAEEYNLYVIEDNAQSLGAKYAFSDGHQEMTGLVGTIGCTSFFPSKNLGCFGDGGAIFCRDAALAEKIRVIAHHGQRMKYHHEIVGCNSRLDAIQAAVLDVKLRHLDEYAIARRKAAAYYSEKFKGFDSDEQFLCTPFESPGCFHVYNQYTLRVKNGRRDELKRHLAEKGIPSAIYYPIPLHKQPAYRQYMSADTNMGNAEELAASVLSLPMHTELTRTVQDRIIQSIIEFFTQKNPER